MTIRPEVLDLMREQGGSFNIKLVELYRVADSENSQKLEQAFSDIFDRFALLVESQEDEELEEAMQDFHTSLLIDV